MRINAEDQAKYEEKRLGEEYDRIAAALKLLAVDDAVFSAMACEMVVIRDLLIASGKIDRVGYWKRVADQAEEMCNSKK